MKSREFHEILDARDSDIKIKECQQNLGVRQQTDEHEYIYLSLIDNCGFPTHNKQYRQHRKKI